MHKLPGTLVILTPAFPENEEATYWIPFQQLFIKELKRNFPQINVIVVAFLYPAFEKEYTWNGVRVIPFNGKNRKGLSHLFLWMKVWRTLKKLRRENKVIGLFSIWCGECALAGKYFGRLYGLKHYCWVCGQDARKTNRLVKFIRPKPEELITMSDFLVNEFYKNHGIRPQYVAPNAIDPAMFLPAYVSLTREIDVLGVGSLSSLKRFDLFIEIVQSLCQQFPGIKAMICGEGDQRTKLQSMITRSGLDQNVTLAGEKKHEEVIEIMHHAKLVLHTSEYEGFGVVCLEALYAGAHVISFSRPMEKAIPHWQIAGNAEEMRNMATDILQDPSVEYKPVLAYKMEDTVKYVMGLFHSSRFTVQGSKVV